MIKDLLITSGYPRSGNTYLNQALNLLYYPEQEANLNGHSARGLSRNGTVIVPFRNPLDAIASWYKYPLPSKVLEDVNYYIRFHTTVLDNLNKLCLMDFDKFTIDINYIKNQIFKNFGLSTNKYVTNEDVKKAMFANDKHFNLPRSNQEELQAAKELVSNTEGFDKCLELYAQLKG